MRISEQFITSLLNRINIIELISKRVNLKEVGLNFIGLCPFHQEKTPSFTVNRQRQFFHCFGCKESGDAIKFFMLTEHKGFLEAVELLANDYGLSLEKDLKQQQTNPLVDNIYKILDLATNFYHQELLKNNKESLQAINYLTGRGINLSTIKNFKLGFANSNWKDLIKFCIKESSHNLKNLTEDSSIKSILQQAGLIIEKNSNFYDRFRSRIIFPIHSKFGKVIGFGGRVINSDLSPKYLNSPETIVFSKQKELYGLYEIKNKLKNLKNIIVVEGYLDVLTLVQSGLDNVVATLGTALNENHIKTIISIVPEIIFCFDGDLAGYKASIKAMEITINMISSGFLHNNHIIKFVALPQDYDPDLFITKKGIKEFQKMLLEAKFLSDFFFGFLLKKYPFANIENLNNLAQEAKFYIEKLPKNLLQDLWYEKLAAILGVTSDLIKPKNNKSNNKYNNIKKTTDTSRSRIDQYKHPISNASKALAMLLNDHSLLSFCESLLSKEKINKSNLSSDLALLLEVINILSNLKIKQDINNQDHLNNKKLVSIEKLATYLEPVYAQKLLSIQIEKILQFIPKTDQAMEQEFMGAVKRINRILIDNAVEELLTLSKQRELVDREKLLLQQLLQQCN